MNSARNKKRARNYRSVDISISTSISIWEAKIWKESTWREKGRRHFEFDPTEGRSDSLRTLYYYFISFPFLSAIINQNKDAKLVPNSHPFSIECPHQSITLAFFPSIPCFFSWLLNNKLSSRITTLSTNHQKNGRNNKFGFFHLGLLLFLWFFVLFCLLYKFSWILKWVLLFYLESSSVSKGESQGTRRSGGFQGTFFASIEWWFFFSRYYLLLSFLFLLFKLPFYY